jgi:hypothetical protein
MSLHSHTFHYDTVAEFVAQLEAMREKLYSSVEQEPYAKVRDRYPHLSVVAFAMRLKRYRGEFPQTRDRRGITHLFVTEGLHNHLSMPLSAQYADKRQEAS